MELPPLRAVALLVTALLLGFAASAPAQALKSPNVEGILFFKEHSFTDSSKDAWPIEFRSAASNGQIILITTREGRRVRALIGQVPDMIPYPGRGGVTRKEALVLCDIALLRYPQHRALLTNIRHAWRQATDRDYETYGALSQTRQTAMDEVIAQMASESDRIRAQMASTPRAPFVSLLDKKPEPAPEPSASSDSSSADDEEPTLRALQEYYKQLQQLGGD